MKKSIIYTFLFACVYFSTIFIHGADVIQFDTTTLNCVQYYDSIDEFKFMDDKGLPLPGYMIFTDKTLMSINELRKILSSVPFIYLKKDGNPHIIEMSQSEKDAINGKNDQDKLTAIGSGYKNRAETDLLNVALIEQLAKAQGISFDEMKAIVEQSIADKLGLPKL